MAKYCSYPGCQTGRDASRAKCQRLEVRQLSVFKVPKNMVQRWSRAIGECLSHTDLVCELHFSNDSIIKEDRIKMPDGTIEVIPHLRHTLIADAMPIAVHNKENGGQPEQNVPCDQLAGPSHGSVAICNDAVVHQVPTTCHDFLTPTEILAEHAHKEESVNGVTVGVLEKYLFPQYTDLASRLFGYLRHLSKATSDHLSQSAFKQQAERLLSIMNDQIILDTYVNVYSDLTPESEVTPDNLRQLILTSYRIAKDSDAGTCPFVYHTINAILLSCFHGKSSLSVGYVSNWLKQHCPRIVHAVHRYVVHVLMTAYRNGSILMSKEELLPHMEPVTPVLEKAVFADDQPLLPMSQVWLLAMSLPLCYIQPEDAPGDGTQAMIVKMSGIRCPSHWTLLYNSEQHGAGANRFLHHVLGYRGPTLLFVRGASSKENEINPIYCICTAVEWRETHLYWGNEDSMVIEMQPAYKVIERGAKLVYLNTGIRGYPWGLRAGSNPRSPAINIDEAFSNVSFGGVTHRIASLEVWGCGDRKSREKQLEIKNWQVKEAEKQRVVKLSTADWLDHPDRYLLELAGRPSYNNEGS